MGAPGGRELGHESPVNGTRPELRATLPLVTSDPAARTAAAGSVGPQSGLRLVDSIAARTRHKSYSGEYGVSIGSRVARRVCRPSSVDTGTVAPYYAGVCREGSRT